MKPLVIFLAGLWVLGIITLQPVTAETEAPDMKHAILREEINSYRSSHNLPGLKTDARLQQAAADKLRDMKTKQYWAHYGPNEESPWQFIEGTDYNYRRAGENLAIGYSSEAAVVQDWIESPAHDEALRGNYSEIGLAAAKADIGKRSGIVVVAMFAEPQDIITRTMNDLGRRTIGLMREVVAIRPPHFMQLIINSS